MFNLYKSYKKTINNLEKELEEQKEKNRLLEHDCILLLDNAEESRNKIKDLKNNVEFLYNNLSPAKKKLAPRD